MKKKTLALITASALLGSLIGCAPLTVINALTSSRSYEKTADIAFGTDVRQRLDVYVPRVIFPHGGWQQDDRGEEQEMRHRKPVSYTHLTLPTIYSV